MMYSALVRQIFSSAQIVAATVPFMHDFGLSQIRDRDLECTAKSNITSVGMWEARMSVNRGDNRNTCCRLDVTKLQNPKSRLYRLLHACIHLGL